MFIKNMFCVKESLKAQHRQIFLVTMHKEKCFLPGMVHFLLFEVP